MMKSKIACLCLALAAGVSAYGATTVTVGPKLDPETGNPLTDPETGMQLGDVDALTNTLKTAGNNTTISLGKGLYDLSPLTNAPMYKADGSGYGAALLHMPYGTLNLEVVGATGNPEDVVL